MHVCVCACVLACHCVFVCSGKSGVWILSSCLSDRKASSVKQRGRQHQSVLCLISAVLHIPSNTELHIGLCTLGLYALTQTVFAGLYTSHMNQTPIWSFQWNKSFLCSCTFSELLSSDKTGVFLHDSFFWCSFKLWSDFLSCKNYLIISYCITSIACCFLLWDRPGLGIFGKSSDWKKTSLN